VLRALGRPLNLKHAESEEEDEEDDCVQEDAPRHSASPMQDAPTPVQSPLLSLPPTPLRTFDAISPQLRPASAPVVLGECGIDAAKGIWGTLAPDTAGPLDMHDRGLAARQHECWGDVDSPASVKASATLMPASSSGAAAQSTVTSQQSATTSALSQLSVNRGSTIGRLCHTPGVPPVVLGLLGMQRKGQKKFSSGKSFRRRVLAKFMKQLRCLNADFQRGATPTARLSSSKPGPHSYWPRYAAPADKAQGNGAEDGATRGEEAQALTGTHDGIPVPEHCNFAHLLWGSLVLRTARDGIPQHTKRHFLSGTSLRGLFTGEGIKVRPPRWTDNDGNHVGVPRTREDMSLRDEKHVYAVYEYMEEAPLLIGSVGSAHRAQSYYRPRSRMELAYAGPELGPFGGRPTRLVGSQPLPEILGQQVRLQLGKAVTVMKSAMIRAPLFRQRTNDTDFLLVRCRFEDGEQWYLRDIERACVVGQTEPLVEICTPISRQCAQRRRRCIRHMVQEAMRRSRRHGDMLPNMEERLAEAVQRWWPIRAEHIVRSECRDYKATADGVETYQPAATPEDKAVLEAMDKGEQLLHSLGIKGLLMCDKPMRKAVEELENLEARRPKIENPMARRSRWVLERLQLTPWHLSHEYDSVVSTQRSLFAVSGPGDPSGGRGEAVSFLHVPVSNVPECLEMSMTQRMTDSELRAALLRLGISEDQLRPLCRQDRLGLLREHNAQLQDTNDSSLRSFKLQAEDKLSHADLKKCHDRLLQEVFDRQMEALNAQDHVITDEDSDSDGSGVEVVRGQGVASRSANPQTTEKTKAPDNTEQAANDDADSGPDTAAGLLDDLEADLSVAGVGTLSQAGAGEEDDTIEMARLRAALIDGDSNTQAASATPATPTIAPNALQSPSAPNAQNVPQAPNAPTAPNPPSAQSAPNVQTAPNPRSAPNAPSALNAPNAPNAPEATSAPTKKVPLLKVVTVEKNPLGTNVERVLYVFGEDHIRRYREQQERAAQVAADVAASRRGGGSVSIGGPDKKPTSVVSSGPESLASSTVASGTAVASTASIKRQAPPVVERYGAEPRSKRLKVLGA